MENLVSERETESNLDLMQKQVCWLGTGRRVLVRSHGSVRTVGSARSSLRGLGTTLQRSFPWVRGRFQRSPFLLATASAGGELLENDLGTGEGTAEPVLAHRG